MGRQKFTQAVLTKFASEGEGLLWDAETRGLGAYRTGQGVSLFVQYRTTKRDPAQRRRFARRLSCRCLKCAPLPSSTLYLRVMARIWSPHNV